MTRLCFNPNVNVQGSLQSDLQKRCRDVHLEQRVHGELEQSRVTQSIQSRIHKGQIFV